MNVKQLDVRLEPYYRSSPDQGIQSIIAQFLHQDPDPTLDSYGRDNGVLVIEKLVRVARNIVDPERADPFSRDELETLTRYCRLGVMMMEQGTYEPEIDDPIRLRGLTRNLYNNSAIFKCCQSEHKGHLQDNISTLTDAISDIDKALDHTDEDSAAVFIYTLRATIREKLSGILFDGEEKYRMIKLAYADNEDALGIAQTLPDKDQELIRHCAHTYALQGRIAKEIADATPELYLKESWLKRSLEQDQEAVQAFRPFDKQSQALASCWVGAIANDLFELTRDQNYREISLSAYRTFVNYFDQHPDPNLRQMYGAARSIINHLDPHPKAHNPRFDDPRSGRKPLKRRDFERGNRRRGKRDRRL